MHNALNLLLQELVTQRAEVRPQSPAVVGAGEARTYAQLEAESNRLGRALRDSGCGRGDRVCLLSHKTPAAVVSILAIYKADGVYVPLDPSGPPARIAEILRACEPRCAIVEPSLLPLFSRALAETTPSARPCIIAMDAIPSGEESHGVAFSLADVAQLPDRPLTYRNRAASPAHILFQVQRTGAPKGIVITHANLRHFVLWANEYFGVRPADRHSGHAPLTHDLSTYDIVGTLAAGACLCLVPDALAGHGADLAAFIAANGLTQWVSGPSALMTLARGGGLARGELDTLTRVIWRGQGLSSTTLQVLMRGLPKTAFTSLYGSAEATIACAAHTVPHGPAVHQPLLPVGPPCRGMEVSVLDDRLEPVGPGEIGEIYVRGAGLSPGYWRDLEATHAAFLPNPRSAEPSDRLYKTGDGGRIGTQGRVYCTGHKAPQSHNRGIAPDLVRVEAALMTLAAIGDAAVVAVPVAGRTRAAICCAYVAATGWRVTAAGLRQQLAMLLPADLLPSRWRRFDHLPLTRRGQPSRRRVRRWFVDDAMAAS